MTTMIFKIYGRGGNELKDTYNPSTRFKTWRGDKIRILNADVTESHLFSLMIITSETPEGCKDAARGQKSDGYFENSKTGKMIDCTKFFYTLN